MAKQAFPLSRAAARHFHKLAAECDLELRKTCEALAADAAAGRALSPAAALLVDNYMFIHGQARDLRDALPTSFYRRLPRASGQGPNDDPRVLHVAGDLLVSTDGELSSERVRAWLRSYQRSTPLLLAELWALGPLLKFTLVRSLCRFAAGESRDTPAAEVEIGRAIAGLRTLESYQWRDVTESVCLAEQVLQKDPSGVYPNMDFQTRDQCRRRVERLARGCDYREEEVARKALDLAFEQAQSKGPDAREAHVGYFLLGPGLDRLRAAIAYRRHIGETLLECAYRWPNLCYVGAITFVTAVMLLAAWRFLTPVPWWYLALLAIPASQAALSAVNRVVHLVIPPRRLPRMDFSEGIPDDCRTFVVIPTLMLSQAEVDKLLERLEIHYLANREPNLYFALLTDFPDSQGPEGNPELLEACANGIRILNRRYGFQGTRPFYLFHRGLEWNPAESVWMGHERKRGKLNDFNSLLCGKRDAFITKVGDMSILPRVRYVLTLDSDTQLPRDTARDLVATMAHPLNRPVVDPATNLVREGYGLLQPRVSVSMESAGRSRLAQIYGGQPGFDPYTTTISDVYQDLHGNASFTGKGLYDVAAFEQVMAGRFPDNTLLSHDLIEGEHTRVGLATELEVVDDYPSTYESYCRRKHRWVRGDWQILRWLLPRVPDAGGSLVRNSLGVLSRWKILDNLRRSLVEVALVVLLCAGWFGATRSCFSATVTAIAVYLLPVYTELFFSLLRLPPRRFWRSYFRELLFRFGQGHSEAFFNMAFVFYQAMLMADAVARTLTRSFVTHRKLLEWETMAQSEAGQQRRGTIRTYFLLCPPVALALAGCLALSGAPVDRLTAILVALWAATPLTVLWVNARPFRYADVAKNEQDFLRAICLRTWRYFADYEKAEDHWLVPDNVQEQPEVVARRTSPTNMGLQLTANLAAFDLGYISHQELAMRVARVSGTLRSMERRRGHFYNWYDTRTLQALPPHYISTVDSGNLAVSLLALKQGCLGMRDSLLVDLRTLAGLRDHCTVFRDLLPVEARTSSIMRLIVSLQKQLAYTPTDLFYWEGVLTEVQNLAERLSEPVEWICHYLEERGASQQVEIRYWYETLVERARTAAGDLRQWAPWLAEPFETELRMCSSDHSMAELMLELYSVPRLGELPARYASIAAAIRRRLEAPHPLHESTARLLNGLLGELTKAEAKVTGLLAELDQQAVRLSHWVDEMDFAFLFNKRRKLLSIGWNGDLDHVDQAHYDVLASEARAGVFIAIAKGDVPRESWFRLQRKLTSYHGYRTLQSWSGTMFEYLMPALHMKTYTHTLLAESLITAVRVQQRYGRERNVPWGISEAACATRDHALNYQYRPFGIPNLAADPKPAEGLVIAPYATMLAAMVDRAGAARNLHLMASLHWTGRYGFYESMDYSNRPALVRMYMVHHQGMGLLALTNALLDFPMQTRFHADPLVVSTEYLLQERLPTLQEVTEEERLHPEPVAARAGVEVVPQPEAGSEYTAEAV